MKRSLFKTVTASLIGNLFEWYDFALFGYFAPIIGKLFFPSENKSVELIAAFGAFAAGYLIRPLGGMIFGHIGDRMGRKKAMVWSILLMAVPTALIGVLPTYAEIGIWAPILLMAIRMLQGISMGGNYGGSITFTTEHTDPSQRGLIGSFAVTSCLLGILVGSGAAALANYIFSEPELMSWGWRAPFIVGILICFVGFYIRRNIPESPEYIIAQEAGELKKNPIREVFASHGRTLVKVVMAVMLHDLSFYILLVYMATHLSTQLGLSQGMALAINTASLVVVSIFTVISAWLSDKIGRKAVLGGAAFLFVIGTIPLLSIVNNTQDPWVILGAQMLLSIAVGGYFGPLPALMVEAYPTAVRFSAVTITTNISGPLFGGTAPMLVTFLIDKTGSNMVPAFYLTFGAVIALIVLRSIKNQQKDGATDLNDFKAAA
ncbi:MFS transporter [Candidatus Odyssella acanthamoebae]|uniref:MFS transporter n=1 Tax=Candidatus Odyssella acanthamoebae TaxID=91604 RepID=UPI0006892FF0|nr:MFS transporter [Candidatus Paracaedibacter acanthamoebae]